MQVYHAMTDLSLVDKYWDMVAEDDPMRSLNVLTSWKYYAGQQRTMARLKDEGKVASAFLDSQTWPINPDGENPGLVDEFDRYIPFVKRYNDPFDWVANYDARFNDPAYNQTNYEIMRDALGGMVDSKGRLLRDKLVPVIHSKEDAADEFYSYVEDGAKRIGIGSKPKVPDDQMELINEIRIENNVGIHVFGNLGFKRLLAERPESADSTRYARATMHGRELWFWDAEINKPVNVNTREPGQVTAQHMEFIRRTFDMSLSDVLSDVKNMWVVNLYAMQQMQAHLTGLFSNE